MQQIDLELCREVDGLQLGVDRDGTPFMGIRSVAGLCGIADHTTIAHHLDGWESGDRRGEFSRYLVSQAFPLVQLSYEMKIGGVTLRAVPESVIHQFLLFYATGARQTRPEALKNLQLLVGHALRAFVYKKIGWQESRSNRGGHEIDVLVDRITTNPAPDGYFSILRASSDWLFKMHRAGLPIGAATIPDISIGKRWGEHWDAHPELAAVFGQRVKYPHRYPDVFGQSKAGPVDAWAYPTLVLGEFTHWLETSYRNTFFPEYLTNKTREKNAVVTPTEATRVLRAVGSIGNIRLRAVPNPKKMRRAGS